MGKFQKMWGFFCINKTPKKKDENNLNAPELLGEKTYFHLARSWADDFYTGTVTSRNRWRVTCIYFLSPVILILLLIISLLIPSQHLQPLIIHHYENGVVTVEPLRSQFTPKNRAEVESDIVRYITNRESYSSESYSEQYSLVNLLSSNSVSDEYVKAQSSQNKNAPVNTLGEKSYRTVQVLNVLFLDKESESVNAPSQHNLAQVDFVVTTHDKTTGQIQNIPMSAIISWEYRKRSNNPAEAWQNWDGFFVTHYEVKPQVQAK